MVQIKHFTTLQKMPNFPIFKTCKLGIKYLIKYLTPPSVARKLLLIKVKLFSYSLDKAFLLPEFQAKLFFTRN